MNIMARILVVDDEATPCRMLQFHLSSLGYEVRTACEADEAVALAREFRPDVLIADWLLRDKTGLDVALAIRGDSPQVRTIFITGLPAGAIASEAGRATDFRIVEKPFDLETLDAAVEQSLQAGTR